MDTDLVERLRAAAPAILDPEPVVVAYLFGSRAAGRPRPDSDTDIAVLVEDDADADERWRLRLRLPSAFERAARTEVDVVVLNDLPLPVRGRAVRQRVVLYSRDEPARVRFEVRTMREFLDFEPRAVAMSWAYLADVAAGLR